MTLHVLSWVGLSAALLICLGLLLGTAWTIQALQPNLSHQAEERRRLNEEWRMVQTTRRKLDQCPRCGMTLGRVGQFAPTLMEKPPADNWILTDAYDERSG